MSRKRNQDRPIHERTDIKWVDMNVGLRGKGKRGGTFAISLAGKPTRAQLAALLAMFDTPKENDE